MSKQVRITRELTNAAAREACLRAGGSANDAKSIREIISQSRFSQRATLPWNASGNVDEYAAAGYRITTIE